MSERIQRRRTRREERTAESTRSAPTDRVVDYDALLAEIDDVLESGAEEYVRGFVQKGGQ